MLDPIQLPILMKAIDFVFDEGRKILEERRERRKSEDAVPENKDQETAQEIAPPVQESKEIKQDLLSAKIEEKLWEDYKEDIKSLVKQLEIHSRNYHLAKEQYAKYGSADVRPITVHNLMEAENAIIEIKKRLEAVLSKVYKTNIHSDK